MATNRPQTLEEHVEALGSRLQRAGIALQRVEDRVEIVAGPRARVHSMRLPVFLDLAERLSRLEAWVPDETFALR